MSEEIAGLIAPSKESLLRLMLKTSLLVLCIIIFMYLVCIYIYCTSSILVSGPIRVSNWCSYILCSWRSTGRVYNLNQLEHFVFLFFCVLCTAISQFCWREVASRRARCWRARWNRCADDDCLAVDIRVRPVYSQCTSKYAFWPLLMASGHPCGRTSVSHCCYWYVSREIMFACIDMNRVECFCQYLVPLIKSPYRAPVFCFDCFFCCVFFFGRLMWFGSETVGSETVDASFLSKQRVGTPRSNNWSLT